MTHIDTLAHIQSCVRDGAKWEVMTSPLPNELWYSPIDQSVDNLNRLAFERKIRLAPKPPRYWSKPEDVPGPVCWIRWCNGSIELVTAIRNDGLCIDSKYWHWSHFADVEHSTDLKLWNPCTCAVEEER